MLPACLLLLSAALLQAHANIHLRCTEVTGGRLTGHERDLEPEVLPAGERRYNVSIPLGGLGCDPGVIVTVCDLLPPQVELADDLGSVQVLRLGPTWQPALLEVVLFCTSLQPTTRRISEATTPAIPATTETAHIPVLKIL